jgi:hypothetical protein
MLTSCHLPALLPTYLPIFYLLTRFSIFFLPFYLHAYHLAYLPTYLSTSLPISLPLYLPPLYPPPTSLPASLTSYTPPFFTYSHYHFLPYLSPSLFTSSIPNLLRPFSYSCLPPSPTCHAPHPPPLRRLSVFHDISYLSDLCQQ